MKFIDILQEDTNVEKQRLIKKTKLIYKTFRKGKIIGSKLPPLPKDMVISYELPEEFKVYIKKDENGLFPKVDYTCNHLTIEVTGENHYSHQQLVSLVMYSVGQKFEPHNIEITCLYRD